MDNNSVPEPETNTAPPRTEMLAARQVALHILDQVLTRRRSLDQVLESDELFRSLISRDRAFVRMLTATTLRRLGQIDDFLGRALEKKEPPKPPLLYNLLRMGVAQIVFMDVPDYAVVDTSVSLAERLELSRQKGLVNAVLRRITRDYKTWMEKQDEVRLNTPAWLMKIWIADYGLRIAAEIAQANLSEAPLDITLKNQGMLDYWTETLDAAALPTGAVRRTSGGQIQELPGYDDGMWWVQDVAAALPARLFGDVEGKTVVDLCAAPGGKTAQLAAQGASVIALDRSVKRLKRLEENMRRLRLEKNVKTEAADAAVWKSPEPVDMILLDVPCTATGTIRRHPDILYLKVEQDIAALAALQARLLDNAVAMLAPGGILVYCTCSLQKAEGEDQIDRLLNSDASVTRVPVTAEEIGGIEGLITEAGDVRALPFHLAAHGGMDGFFISRLRKD